MTWRSLIVFGTTGLLSVGAPSYGHASPDFPMCVADQGSLIESPVSIVRPWATPMCGPYPAPPTNAEPRPLSERAIEAYRAASRLIVEAAYEGARLELDLASEGLPRVRDHIFLQKARLELLRGRPEQAAVFFVEASDTIHESVRIQASFGRTLALLRADDPSADQALHDLLWTYPSVPDRTELLYEQARSLSRRGREQDGALVLHRIRVEHPGTPLGERVIDDLDRFARLGVAVPVLSDEERVAIAHQLVRSGPLDRAKSEVNALLEAALPTEQMARVHYLAGRLARNEGRWDEAVTYLRTAHALPEINPATAQEIEQRADDLGETASAREREVATSSIDRRTAGRSLTAIPSSRLCEILEIASAASMAEVVDDVLVTLAAREGVPKSYLFDAAMAAAGTGSEGLIIAVLDRIAKGSSRLRVAASYHLGRAHERAGRAETAKLRYLQVAEAGDSYYELWAINGLSRLAAGKRVEAPEGLSDSKQHGLPRPPQSTDADLADALDPIADRHSSTFPGVGRAADLLRIGERDAATEELFEAYLHWRHALGKPVARAGLDSVARADSRSHGAVATDVIDARVALSDADRATLSATAAALGDSGTAGGFAGPSYIEALPRAYEWLVVPAAARYGLDPNLLLAVMRVESAYQQHIVSYAGAVGLMQIMPRTGRLIAHAVGHENFSPADLLDPKTNVEFAAWYLTSLIHRFDGRLPLAIAAYNGGPHNVRRWMQESSDGTSVDVLLERIPFTQTHRYVRRVLVYYDAYRKQQALTAPRLSTALPVQRVDPLSFGYNRRMDATEVDVVVIGAGVVGVACALDRARASDRVALLERDIGPGREISSRNSGVVHAGLYYPDDSLKTRLCVQGRDRLYQWCETHGVPHAHTGKLIVATSALDDARLRALASHAAEVGAGRLEWLSATEARAREPELSCVSALYSPKSGVVDVHELIASLLTAFRAAGGDVAFRTSVVGIERNGPRWIVRTIDTMGRASEIVTRRVINSAGLQAVDIAAMSGLVMDPPWRLYPCKGSYFSLGPAAPPTKHSLIYPLPTGGGLGVHITTDLAGGRRAGPDAEYIDEVNYDVDESRAVQFAEAVARYLPGVTRAHLSPDYAGVRPKLVGPKGGFADFVIEAPPSQPG
ncbi:MAG: FAD-dependent oxidoreductase, partial [Polyangiales bacterium]